MRKVCSGGRVRLKPVTRGVAENNCQVRKFPSCLSTSATSASFCCWQQEPLLTPMVRPTTPSNLPSMDSGEPRLSLPWMAFTLPTPKWEGPLSPILMWTPLRRFVRNRALCCPMSEEAPLDIRTLLPAPGPLASTVHYLNSTGMPPWMPAISSIAELLPIRVGFPHSSAMNSVSPTVDRFI